MFGRGSRMIVLVPKDAAWVRQARSIFPLMTMAQEPQTADLHEDLKARVPSISSLILRRTMRMVSPGITLILYDCKYGSVADSAASYRRILKVK
jgi:hypothetical protein